MWNWWRRRSIIKMVVGDTADDNSEDNEETLHRMAQWEKDYTLNPVPDDYMFNEYLEMGNFHSKFFLSLFILRKFLAMYM